MPVMNLAVFYLIPFIKRDISNISLFLSLSVFLFQNKISIFEI
ncbi:hypothetical protein appser6_12570 [Actinobacillus pleuropneumoniae serovar 6 str. Femo]|uniref:Uncharacterized protein n=1 Tax=Actinobacillus pleuropneumoniae serovar 6 str. Femo TaxID=754256 RepID=A0A828PT64_ACTPL|nr:hypothetical protein appser6_12570 [Actinobacillus pleuropneumoniae serovar 6 str. Femo]EFN02635.1 hypothetical protein appser13_11870 [Actinobacillus pleuropneumoniae serovar 13 str. N273]